MFDLTTENTTDDIYLFGATSIIGWNIYQRFRDRVIPFCNLHTKSPQCRSWSRINLEDEGAIADLFRQTTPRILIHCGGICDVEKCETNADWARLINVDSVEVLLRYVPAETRLVYCSSDHVFGGDGNYTENSETQPLSIYGKTRVAAEELIKSADRNALIIRSGLPIGPSINHRTGHLDWLRYRTGKRLPTTIIRDEFRSAVKAADLGDRIMEMAESSVTGVRHIPAHRVVSRLELARYLLKSCGNGGDITVKHRNQLSVPHLGRVEISSTYNDRLAMPLAPVMVGYAPK